MKLNLNKLFTHELKIDEDYATRKSNPEKWQLWESFTKYDKQMYKLVDNVMEGLKGCREEVLFRKFKNKNIPKRYLNIYREDVTGNYNINGSFSYQVRHKPEMCINVDGIVELNIRTPKKKSTYVVISKNEYDILKDIKTTKLSIQYAKMSIVFEEKELMRLEKKLVELQLELERFYRMLSHNFYNQSGIKTRKSYRRRNDSPKHIPKIKSKVYKRPKVIKIKHSPNRCSVFPNL